MMRWGKAMDPGAVHPPGTDSTGDIDAGSLPSGLAVRLADWQAAGLIGADTASRIAAFEAARHRPRLPAALAIITFLPLAYHLVYPPEALIDPALRQFRDWIMAQGAEKA